MARRRHTHNRKIAPANLTLEFVIDSDTPEEQFIDIAQCLSQLNRKFYRQGREYVVSGTELISDSDSQVVLFAAARNWPMFNSHTKGFALWKQQQDDAVDEAGLESTIAKYRDFKVYLNDTHSNLGSSSNLHPLNIMTLADAQAIDPDVRYEWNMSDVVVPNDDGVVGDTETYRLHLCGPDTPSTRGLINAYAQSRSRPQTPDPNIVNVPMGGLFGEMFNTGMDDEEIIDLVQGENNNPPYLIADYNEHQFYPGVGNDAVDTGLTLLDNLTIGSNGRLVSSYGGAHAVPCGLINVKSAVVGTAVLKVTLASGPYKGTMSMDMKEVN